MPDKEVEWKPMRASPEKFLKAENFLAKSFSGILEAIYPSETKGEKPTPLIRFDFEGGSSLSIFGLDKRNDDGTYPFALGSFIKSVEDLGLEVQEAEDEGIVQRIRLTKDGVPLEKPKVWIRGIEDKTVGDDSQTKSYFKWGILEKYEAAVTEQASANVKKPGKYPPKPKIKEQPMPIQITSEDIKLIETVFTELKSIRDAYLELDKKLKPAEIRAILENNTFKGRVLQEKDGNGNDVFQVV